MDNELILDTDVYQSGHRIPSLGKGTLEDDTLPVKYSDGQWENIREHLDFPVSELDGKPYRSTTHTGTVLPAKSDSDVMFCLQSYQGLRIDRSLV